MLDLLIVSVARSSGIRLFYLFSVVYRAEATVLDVLIMYENVHRSIISRLQKLGNDSTQDWLASPQGTCSLSKQRVKYNT